ncbi:MAG TPA: hypothetical protein VIQ02_11965, partial [Jiangellaceae bacterium]
RWVGLLLFVPAALSAPAASRGEAALQADRYRPGGTGARTTVAPDTVHLGRRPPHRRPHGATRPRSSAQWRYHGLQ